MNFILFVVLLIALYWSFPLIIGTLTMAIPESALDRAPRLEAFIISLVYGFLIGLSVYYFGNRPSVEFHWLYKIFGGFMALALPYRIEAMTGVPFMLHPSRISPMERAFQRQRLITIWLGSLVGYVVTIIILSK